MIDKEMIWKIFEEGFEYALIWKKTRLPADNYLVKFIRPVFDESIFPRLEKIMKENPNEDYISRKSIVELLHKFFTKDAPKKSYKYLYYDIEDEILKILEIKKEVDKN